MAGRSRRRRGYGSTETEKLATGATWSSIATGLSLASAAPFVVLIVIIDLAVRGLIDPGGIMAALATLVLAPIAITVGVAYKKNIEWDYPDRVSRLAPLAGIVAVYAAGLAATWIAGLGAELAALMASYTLNGAVAWLITLRYKVSLHIVGIAGPATYMALLGYYAEAAILYTLSGVVAAARHHLGRHSVGQLLLAYLVSITLTYIAFNATVSVYTA